MRKFFSILLIALIPLQAMALQGVSFGHGESFDLTHERMHEEVTSHHHDDDGTIHFSDSKESLKHLADHTGNFYQPGLLPTASLPDVTLQALSRVFVPVIQLLPDPFLEDPQRPPQTTS